MLDCAFGKAASEFPSGKLMSQRLDVPDPIDQVREPERVAMPEAARPKVARLPGIATQLIGERMRAMYASMTREPVPDDLLALVRKLDDKERAE